MKILLSGVLLVLGFYHPTGFAQYFSRTVEEVPRHFRTDQGFDTQSEAMQDCVAWVEQLGYTAGYCQLGGNESFSVISAGYLCADGPACSSPIIFKFRSNYFCPSGKRYSPTTARCETHTVIDDTTEVHGSMCGYGNPVYPLTGSKRQLVDLGIALGGLPFQAIYDSRRKVPSVGLAATIAAPASPSFGPLWESSWHRRLVVQGLAGSPERVLVGRGGGQWISFAIDGGALRPAPNINDRLEAVSAAAGWRYLDAASQSIETYDAEGKLVTIHRASGAVLLFKYSDATTAYATAPRPGLLIRVEDHQGRGVDLAYELASGNAAFAPRIRLMRNAAGHETTFAYDAFGNLSALTWPDGRRRQFVYGQVNLPWALTGIIDERNELTSMFAYDESGRAIETQRAGGVDRYVMSWESPPARTVSEEYDPIALVSRRIHRWQLPTGTSVRLPNGESSNLGVTAVQGSPVLNSTSQPAGAGCAASSSAQVIDVNGNALQRDDFTGRRSCHAYDSVRNVEAVRVEGLANTQACSAVTPTGATLPAGARKTSTQWHPDWRLAVKVAEPRRLTTSVYNGQPDPFAGNAIASCAPATVKLPDGKPLALLCSRVEQATLDGSGSAGLAASIDASVPSRTWRYTYDEWGQLLTVRDPLGSVTTSSYYPTTGADATRGDMQVSTNALGQVTRYTKYNKLGQVLQSVDSNGVVTDYEFDSRQRLTRESSAGESTVFTQSATGQLQRVTHPDGSYIGYEYDAAQRLVAVTDQLGNRIEYTLDNSGRRREERVKDPSGVLKRQVQRVFDALGRVQQVTGE